MKFKNQKNKMVIVLCTLALIATSCVKIVPDAIYINGVVITVDPDRPYAEAFAVAGDRFVAVGTNAQIRRMAASSTRVIDLKGMTVTPGFNDTHVHPHTTYPEDSPYWTPWLGPEVVRSIDDLIAELKKMADRVPPGTLITGSRYQDCWLGRHPTRHDLDKVSTVHPIRISHSSGHVSVVNSFVLDNSGITKDTPGLGDSFDRDPDGTPNGILRAGASSRIRTGATGNVPQPSAETQMEAYRRRFLEYARRGITSIGIAGTTSFQRYEALRDSETIVRMAVMPSLSIFPDIKANGTKSGDGDERMRITAIKMFHGNSFSGNTCWVSEPYEGRPYFFGIPPTRTQASLDSVIQEIHNAGFQVAVHSNGDREIDMTITAIERAQANNPRPDARHRIEHASVMTMPLLERAKKAGIILVFHSYIYEHGEKLVVYGERRLEMVHPYRNAIDMGVYVAGHSDSPIAPAHPMVRIHSMVNRRSHAGRLMGGSQRITVEEAIKVWTLDGAFATFEENNKGSITSGKLADFVVLRQDPRKVPVSEIKDIIVDATYVGGVNVWQAP